MKLTRKSIGRIAAGFVATAMLATMAFVPVSAADPEPITSFPISKTVTTDGNTYAPNTSFTFKVDKGAAITTTSPAILEGAEGGLTAGKDSEIKFVPNTTGNAQPSDSYTGTGALSVDISKFNAAGIYHYVVSENAGEYEGITYDTTVYDVYVYVLRSDKNDPTSNLKVDGIVAYARDAQNPDTAVTPDSGVKALKLAFTNDYGKENKQIHKATVTKIVTGNAANPNDTFEFTVSVTNKDGVATGEAYKVVYTNGGEEQTAVLNSNAEGTSITVKGIKDDDTITIYGLSASDKFTVTETNGTTQGYTVTDTDEASDQGTVTGVADGQDYTETITNTKDATTPTGIMMDIAPYAALVVIAAAGCFIFLRKRHGKED